MVILAGVSFTKPKPSKILFSSTVSKTFDNSTPTEISFEVLSADVKIIYN
jgi:hypothetical protein